MERDLVGDMYSSDEWRVHIEDDLRMERTFEHVTEDCQCEGKQCSSCPGLQCLGAFSPNRRGKQQYKAQCKACRKAYLKTYKLAHYHAHKEQYKAKRKANQELESAKRRANYQRRREEILVSRKAYRQANSEKMRQSRKAEYQRHASTYIVRTTNYQNTHPELRQKWHRNYRKANPDKYVAFKQNRRARIAQSGGQFTDQEWQFLKAYYDYTCVCCGKREPEIKLCVDHVIPVSKGGTSDIDNIQPLCKLCNSRKINKIIDYRR